jgi:hypothetical protein
MRAAQTNGTARDGYVRITVHGHRGFTTVALSFRQFALLGELARGSASSTEYHRIAEVIRKAARAIRVPVPYGRFSSAVRRRALATLRRTYRAEVAAELDRRQFPDGVRIED